MQARMNQLRMSTGAGIATLYLILPACTTGDNKIDLSVNGSYFRF